MCKREHNLKSVCRYGEGWGCGELGTLQASHLHLYCIHTRAHTIAGDSIMCLSMLVFQCDQQSSRPEAGGGDPDVITETHRQHCGHLLCLLHYLWNFGSSGEKGRGGKVHRQQQKHLPGSRKQILIHHQIAKLQVLLSYQVIMKHHYQQWIPWTQRGLLYTYSAQIHALNLAPSC